MSDAKQENPLPKPPTTPFGRKKRSEEEESQPLIADRMAVAAAEGRLDEFLKQEMPDNEQARNLATMMMGMTGMMPMAGAPMKSVAPARDVDQSAQPPQEEVDVPDDVRRAIMSGDVKSLMEKLQREHQKRNPGAVFEVPEAAPAHAPSAGIPAIDKELIDALVLIARDNSVSLDWIMLRAIKVYVQEYQKTGKL